MSDIRTRAVEVGNSAITVNEVLTQFKELTAKLKADTNVQLAISEGYKSRYEILEELRGNVKDTNPSDTRFADLLSRPISGSGEYLELEGYLMDLRPTQYDPTIPEPLSSVVNSSTKIYYTPNYPNLDPRRTGRFLVVDPPQSIRSANVRTWLLNNSMLYGFLLYGDIGLYYEGVAKIRQQIQAGSTVLQLVSKYQAAYPNSAIITTTTQTILGVIAPSNSGVPTSVEYVIGTPVQDNSGGRPKLLVVDNKVITEGLAEAYFTMRSAAQEQGVTLEIVSGFRPAFGPNVMLETSKGRRIAATTQETIRRNRSTWSRRSSWQGDDESFVFQAPSNYFTPTAAKPGTSKHGSGLALDLNTSSRPHLNTSVYVWLVKNAHRYGFVRTVSSEEWHFEYLPQQAIRGPYAVLADTNANRFYADLGLSGLPA